MPDLPKRTLGRTGLEVTTVGYAAAEERIAFHGDPPRRHHQHRRHRQPRPPRCEYRGGHRRGPLPLDVYEEAKRRLANAGAKPE